MSHLPRAFFARPTLEVARGLLGQRLMHVRNGKRLSGLITEVEAYLGEADRACHARVGRTPRTAPMYGPPGRAYIYFTYGLHWLLNFVTEAEGFPAAVLVRAIVPDEGIQVMRRLRRQPDYLLTDGPAKLTQALGMDGKLNGHDTCARGAALFVEKAPAVPQSAIVCGPRVGVDYAGEPWVSKPWNFKWRMKNAE